jgi:para-aminobenzoate synthetase component 1
MHFGVYDFVVTYDHEKGNAHLAAVNLADEPEAKFRERVKTRLHGLLETAHKENSEPLHIKEPSEKAESNFIKDEYLRAVERAKGYIAAGDIYQVNLSQRFSTAAPADAVSLYRALRGINPAPFSAFLGIGDKAVLSSSPERFMKLRGRRAETRPIKGTRPRREGDGKFNALMRAELLASEKDAAELAMIVDLERNDLGRVSEYGSVRVAEPRVIEEYPTVCHLVATVESRLRPDVDALGLIQASFPGGSITGAPKIRAMEIIDDLEPTRRGVYTGSIGYIGFDGNMDTNIVIRTITISGGRAYFQVGGGIVADSEPEAEYQETLDKGRALFRTLGA